MAISGVDAQKAEQLSNRLKQIISRHQIPNEGESILQAISETDPNAATITQVALLFKGSDYMDADARERVRGLLAIYRDQLMTQELIRSQAALGVSTDKLAARTLFATWIGVLVAVVGVAIAIIAIVK